ncbi:hypothetical protein [Vibrio furnissii]|nr:hypothetical protein [Vibrio furnissii]
MEANAGPQSKVRGNRRNNFIEGYIIPSESDDGSVKVDSSMNKADLMQ